MQLKALIDAYLASYQGRDPSLFTRLAFWRERLGEQPIAEIDADAADAQLEYLAQRGARRHLRGRGVVSANRPLSPATLNRYIVALGSVMTYARKRRLLPRTHVSPIKGLDKYPEPEGRLIYLTEQQVEKVIACAALAQWRKLPVLIRMAFTTGLRRGALQQLRWRDVDLVNSRALVERTKNGRPHVAHLTPATVTALKAMPGHRLPNGLVFSGADEQRPHDFRKAWEVACDRAGLGHVQFHALRHSCASHLAAQAPRVCCWQTHSATAACAWCRVTRICPSTRELERSRRHSPDARAEDGRLVRSQGGRPRHEPRRVAPRKSRGPRQGTPHRRPLIAGTSEHLMLALAGFGRLLPSRLREEKVIDPERSGPPIWGREPTNETGD